MTRRYPDPHRDRDRAGLARQPSSPLAETVRRFWSRRKWRHIVAMGVGVLLLTFGSATVGAHIVHATLPTGTAGIATGAACYGIGVLAYAYGGAGGNGRRFAKWLLGTAVLGLLSVLIFSLAGVFPDAAADIGYAQQQTGTPGGPARVRPPRAPRERDGGSGLAAQLIAPGEVERLLGPNTAAPRTYTLRNRALATWTHPARRPTTHRPEAARNRRILTLTVGRSGWQAHRMRNGYLPPRARSLTGLGEAAYIQSRVRSASTTTRIRAVRGTWVVAIQLTSDVAGDPNQLLAAAVTRALDLLAWAI